MLKTTLIHPQILAALGRGGHSSKVLIADGNYPVWTRRGPHAEVVNLNLSPDLLKATEVLNVILQSVPVEAAVVMAPNKTGPYKLKQDPPIFTEYAALLDQWSPGIQLKKIERFAFYDAASTPDVCLAIATGESRIYANILLTIGVVR
jgi:L-fucose mutarotase